MEHFIKEYWYIFAGAFVTAGWWIIRKVLHLEDRVCQHTNDIAEIKDNQEKKIDEVNHKLDKVFDKVSDLGERFSRLAGYLERLDEEWNKRRKESGC